MRSRHFFYLFFIPSFQNARPPFFESWLKQAATATMATPCRQEHRTCCREQARSIAAAAPRLQTGASKTSHCEQTRTEPPCKQRCRRDHAAEHTVATAVSTQPWARKSRRAHEGRPPSHCRSYASKRAGRAAAVAPRADMQAALPPHEKARGRGLPPRPGRAARGYYGQVRGRGPSRPLEWASAVPRHRHRSHRRAHRHPSLQTGVSERALQSRRHAPPPPPKQARMRAPPHWHFRRPEKRNGWKEKKGRGSDNPKNIIEWAFLGQNSQA